MGFELLMRSEHKPATSLVFFRQEFEIVGASWGWRVLGSARQSRGAAWVVETEWRRSLRFAGTRVGRGEGIADPCPTAARCAVLEDPHVGLAGSPAFERRRRSAPRRCRASPRTCTSRRPASSTARRPCPCPCGSPPSSSLRLRTGRRTRCSPTLASRCTSERSTRLRTALRQGYNRRGRRVRTHNATPARNRLEPRLDHARYRSPHSSLAPRPCPHRPGPCHRPRRYDQTTGTDRQVRRGAEPPPRRMRPSKRRRRWMGRHATRQSGAGGWGPRVG